MAKNNFDKALTSFISPDNLHLKYENFVSEIINQFLDVEGVPKEEFSHISKSMMDIFDQIKDTRQFNEKYIGHMLSEASIPGMLGFLLAIRLGSNTVAPEVSLYESRLEKYALDGLIDIVGYKKGIASGTFTSGGSMAVLTALAVARKKLFARFEDNEQARPSKVAIITTRMAHYSFLKAISLLGGIWEDDSQIIIAETKTRNFKMTTENLETAITDLNEKGIPIMAIYAIAGETETGLVDPLYEISKIAEKYKIFSIADGAYGAPYKLSSVAKKLLRGIENFDSIIIDGHKSLYTPYSNGSVLFKNAEDHYKINLGVVSYIGMGGKDQEEELDQFRRGGENLGAKRLEGSMGSGPILSTLAVLKIIGKDGLEAIYDHTIARTRHLFDIIEKSELFWALHEPHLNLLCFQLENVDGIIANKFGGDKERYKGFITDVRRELDNGFSGTDGYYLSSTELPDDSNLAFSEPYFIYNKKGNKEDKKLPACFRACIMNPRTSDTTINEAIKKLEEIIKEKLSL